MYRKDPKGFLGWCRMIWLPLFHRAALWGIGFLQRSQPTQDTKPDPNLLYSRYICTSLTYQILHWIWQDSFQEPAKLIAFQNSNVCSWEKTTENQVKRLVFIRDPMQNLLNIFLAVAETGDHSEFGLQLQRRERKEGRTEQKEIGEIDTFQGQSG